MRVRVRVRVCRLLNLSEGCLCRSLDLSEGCCRGVGNRVGRVDLVRVRVSVGNRRVRVRVRVRVRAASTVASSIASI